MADFESNQGGRRFRVGITAHPAHNVTNLMEAGQFFAEVFGRPSISVEEVLNRVPHMHPDFPREYASFTLIADIFFDSIDPSRLVMPFASPDPSRLVIKDGNNFLAEARHPAPHLERLGWFVSGHVDAFRALRSGGFTIRNTIGEIQDGSLPTGPNDPAPFFTVPEETGVIYEFYPATGFPCDPRTESGWTLPRVSEDDPLGIERCSHHTFLTDQPARPRNILVDILGGKALGEGRNRLLGTDSTYLRLGDSTLEFAVPDKGTPAHQDWVVDAPNDTYHSITWKVTDLERTERHLEQHGVGIRSRTADSVVTDPRTSLGIPWGFCESLVPGDPRETEM